MSKLSVANANSTGAVGRQTSHEIGWDPTEDNVGFAWPIHIDGRLKTTPVGLVLDQPQEFRRRWVGEPSYSLGIVPEGGVS